MRLIDHYVLVAGNLTDSRKCYQQMGFNVAPDGVHPFGTYNANMYFRDGPMIETLAIENHDKYSKAIKAGNTFIKIDAVFRATQGDEVPSAEALEDIGDSYLKSPILNCFVAEVDDALVSTTTLAIVPNLTRGCRPYGLIENVVTHESYRGRGIGKEIMQYTLNYAWQAQCYKIMLLSNSTRQDAHQFYRSCGFQSDKKQGFIIRPKE